MREIYEFHYSAQTRRFLEQIVRAFSGFQYQVGGRSGQPGALQVVPARMASQNRQVANLMRNNSQNAVLAVPLITVFIANMRYDRERQQNPNFISKVHVVEREVDHRTGTYSGERGNAYTVERFMPMPFELTIQVDVWTSNMDQKLQLHEQIVTTFAVGFDIQNSDNALDWSALTTMYLEDINWSSAQVPAGTEDVIDVTSYTFKLPIWYSPPAKIKQQKLIQQIAQNIHNEEGIGLIPECDAIDYGNSALIAQIVTTPGNHQIAVSGNEITLLNNMGNELDDTGNPLDWRALIERYGVLQPALSQLRLITSDDIEDPRGIVGTIQYDPLRSNVLLWQVDPETLPANTMPPITGIIDPMAIFPGVKLPAAGDGQRYLLLNDIGTPTVAWGNVVARTNDIIEFQNDHWTVVFDSRTTLPDKFVLNSASGKQLRWTGHEWIMAIDGEYHPGFWRLAL